MCVVIIFVCVCLPVEARGQSMLGISNHSIFIFEAGFLHELKGHRLGWVQ